MAWWQALILGLVEGITEYLPVSSTGHLLLTQRLLGIGQSTSADAYAICIQAGAIFAVLTLYLARVRQMAAGLLGRDPAGARLARNVVLAFIPAAAVGLLLEDQIKRFLFAGEELGLWPIIWAWAAGGLLILAHVRATRYTDRERGNSLGQLTAWGALGIGLIQCAALWPGMSRSLVTILGGLLVGLALPAALEFSFLLGLVTLTAATAMDAVRHGAEMLAEYGPTCLLVGFVAAWLSAVLAVKWMIGYLTRHGMALFGWYRIGLAAVVALAVYAGWIH